MTDRLRSTNGRRIRNFFDSQCVAFTVGEVITNVYLREQFMERRKFMKAAGLAGVTGAAAAASASAACCARAAASAAACAALACAERLAAFASNEVADPLPYA